MSYKTQKRWESIGVAIVVVVLVFAAVSLLMNAFNKNDDDFEKARLTWSVGGLDSKGAFLKSETDSCPYYNPYDEYKIVRKQN